MTELTEREFDEALNKARDNTPLVRLNHDEGRAIFDYLKTLGLALVRVAEAA